MFNERAYLEILEFLSEKLEPKTEVEGKTIEGEFKMMYTVKGAQIKTIEDLQDFILERRNEQLYPD